MGMRLGLGLVSSRRQAVHQEEGLGGPQCVWGNSRWVVVPVQHLPEGCRFALTRDDEQ